MSLYLKYRPQDFDNLVGQDFINKTLKKAINEDKLVGAYLFCGPRGTGKTSTARIFAKTINCKEPRKGNPCLKCDICTEFLEEKLIDIIEIDAASHTGVDNIREIIEKANFRPTKTKYKVYIIDEVHMLSKGAFNALLKILEEPPEHVKFILATTETHKVPETIISRCQRYDFKKISPKAMHSRLSYIAKSEKISIDEKSLKYIEKASSGGLRNAISLFEQLNDSGNIKYETIIEKLGIVGNEKLDLFLNKLLNKDSSIIKDFDEINQEGKNLKLFFRELIFFTRDRAIIEINSGKNISSLISILDTLDKTYIKTKASLDENTTLLIGVLKIINNSINEPLPTIKQDKSPASNLIAENKQEKSKKEEKKEETPKKEAIKPEVKKEIEKTEEKKISKEEISHSDVGDIFGSEKNTPAPKGDNSFDKVIFINTLKKSGAKGGLTMGLRGADISLVLENLHIKSKTSFALKQINTTDNLNLINKALESLGFDYKIIMS